MHLLRAEHVSVQGILRRREVRLSSLSLVKIARCAYAMPSAEGTIDDRDSSVIPRNAVKKPECLPVHFFYHLCRTS